MNILEKITDAKYEYQRRQDQEPTHVILSQSDYDELWQTCVELISGIDIDHRGLRYAIKEMPRFMDMYNGLVPLVGDANNGFPCVASYKTVNGDTLSISDILKGSG